MTAAFLASLGAAASAPEKSCEGEIQDPDTGIYYRATSFARLLAAPEDLVGCPVTTVGVLGAEEAVLYLSEEDMRNAVAMNGIELLPPFAPEVDMGSLAGKRVVVRGVFGGRVNFSEGSLSEIADMRPFGVPRSSR